jgi:hypothetical protein
VKSLKSIGIIKRRAYLHPCRWIKCSLVCILSITLLLLFSFFEENNIAFGATILSHGMCEENEVPEDFNGTPPQDRRVFQGGEEVCVWLVVPNPDASYVEFRISVSWYQPDGSKLNPTKSHFSMQRSFESDKVLVSSCLMESGEDGVKGIPNIRGEWLAKVYDTISTKEWIYDETFIVGSNGSVTTTIIDGETSTTSTGDMPTTTTSITSCPSETIYGEHSEETEILRYFRDNVLAQTPEGQEIIKLYYQWSPVIVEMMNEDEEFKSELKEMIDGILEMIE